MVIMDEYSYVYGVTWRRSPWCFISYTNDDKILKITNPSSLYGDIPTVLLSDIFFI